MLEYIRDQLVLTVYMLLHWGTSCRSNLQSHPVTVYWLQSNQSKHWPSHHAAYPPEYQFLSHWWVCEVPVQRRHRDCRTSTAALPTTWCFEAGHVAEPIPLRDKLYGNLEGLKRTVTFVRATASPSSVRWRRSHWDDSPKSESMGLPGFDPGYSAPKADALAQDHMVVQNLEKKKTVITWSYTLCTLEIKYDLKQTSDTRKLDGQLQGTGFALYSLWRHATFVWLTFYSNACPHSIFYIIQIHWIFFFLEKIRTELVCVILYRIIHISFKMQCFMVTIIMLESIGS